MSRPSFPADAEGLSKPSGFTVFHEDLPTGISGREGLEALDRMEDTLCQMQDYSYSALYLAEGRLLGSIENERLSAIYTLISTIRGNIRSLEGDYKTVSGFCDALCKRIET
ncbi:hypothetical protein ABE527_05720 [Brucella sp. TWI432]